MLYNLIGGPRIFAIGSEHPNPDCAVETVVNEAVEGGMREAEALLIVRLGEVSLAELAKCFDMRCTGAIDARAPKQT